VAGLAAVDDLSADELDLLGRLGASQNATPRDERAVPGDDGETVVAQRELVALGGTAQGLADRGVDARSGAQVAAQGGGEDAGPQLALAPHLGADEIDELAGAEEADVAGGNLAAGGYRDEMLERHLDGGHSVRRSVAALLRLLDDRLDLGSVDGVEIDFVEA